MTDGLQMILKAALNHPIGRLTSDAMLAIGEAPAITLDLDL